MAQVQAYRSSYGGNLTDDILQQMQVPQQVLQQMIQEKAELTEAERAGITVSDAEVRAQIVAIPGLQENGQFIGEQRYRAAPGAAEPADDAGRLRAVGAREPDARQVPRRAHRMDDGVGRRARARIQAPQRKSDARRRRRARRQLQDAGESDRRRDLRALRQEQGAVPHSRSPQDQVRADQPGRARGEHQGVEGRRRARATTSSSANTRRPNRFARATSC